MKHISFLTLALCSLLAIPGGVRADEPTAETVVDGLNNPCGVAIHPTTGTIYVSDSGAGRICKIQDGKAVPVITDFPMDVYGKGPKYDIGPLGLAFLDENHLVVGGGGLPDGEELLRLYKLPEEGQTIKASDMVSSGLIAPEGDIVGEGNFYAVGISGDKIFVSANGDDTKGWVGKATIKDGKIASFERGIATKEAVQVDAPVGLTIDPKKGYLVIGQMGEITVPGDSLLSFYSVEDGKLLANFETGLSDITAVAYNEATYQMYCTDFSWHDTTQGGLFHMIKTRDEESGKSGCKAEKLMSLDKPTAMVIDKEGNAYVTVIGTAEGETKGGKLLKIKLPKID